MSPLKRIFGDFERQSSGSPGEQSPSGDPARADAPADRMRLRQVRWTKSASGQPKLAFRFQGRLKGVAIDLELRVAPGVPPRRRTRAGAGPTRTL